MNTFTDKDDKKAFVRTKFSAVTGHYDFLNTLLSLSIDRYWRKSTARAMKSIPDGPLLDVCAGTLPLSLELKRRTGRPVMALDFCLDMLQHGWKRINRYTRRQGIYPVQGDAELLPFPASTFSGVTIAFGIRNLSRPGVGLREMFRVLKPGGRLAILEFSRPRRPVFSWIYFLYLHKLLPVIGGALSGDREAYAYLARSIQEFYAPEVLAAMMNDVGFKRVSYSPLTLGIVTLYAGIRPS